ncbi:MAG: S49 family peptidase [Candidatus Spyradenecus sp.]
MSSFSAIFAILPSAAPRFWAELPLYSASFLHQGRSSRQHQDRLPHVLNENMSSASLPSSPLGASAEGPLFGNEATIIPVKGFIFEGFDIPGVAVSPSAIQAAIDKALSEGAQVVLDIDSPGGAVDGVAELADYIARAVKDGANITAYTRGTCCSAAYWIAAPCARILATRGANIGNCGCWAAFPCYAEANAKYGIAINLFASGELKAAGHPDIPLTEAQADFLSSHIRAVADLFFADVRAARPAVDETALTSGAFFLAAQALALGFIDQLVADSP